MKKIIIELIYFEYNLDDTSDFLMIKFLKSWRSEFKFAIKIVEGKVVINIEPIIVRVAEELNSIVIKLFDIASIHEQK